MIAGRRMPPSKRLNFAPRYGPALPPPKNARSSVLWPLSDWKTTIVFSRRPSSSTRREQPAEVLVQGRHEGRVFPPRMGQRAVAIEPFRVALVRIVRHVQGEVHEQRPIAVCLHEPARLGDHQFGEELPVVVDLLAVAPEVVAIGSVPVEEVRIVVDAPAEKAEGIVEPLLVGGHALGEPQVPLADVRGGVAGGLEHLGQGDLPGGQAPSAVVHVRVDGRRRRVGRQPGRSG